MPTVEFPPSPSPVQRDQGQSVVAKPPPYPRSQWALLALLVAGLLAAVAILYFFDPTEHRFYPKCMLYQTTGIQCPGCGGLRAAHALVHGDFKAALSHNPLLVVLSPLLIYILLREIVRACFGKNWPFPFQRPWTVASLLGVLLMYMIWRNLPLFKQWFGGG